MSINSEPGDVQREPGDFKNTGSAPRQIEQLLSSAHEAQTGGRGRLAIHLYCAAFEMSVEQIGKPTGATIDGLRKAWLLACEQGDRQSAETIFNDLLPYNTQQQT
ncbi:MAG: hypothetical protein LBP28_09395, partial [Coriobacteriales bacterium]|nr:hypothetical protein [Coriobacteriales bacterium]